MMRDIEIYQAENGEIEFRGDVKNETIWANLNQLAKLFNRDKSVISRHVKNIFNSGELEREPTVAKIATVQIEGVKKVKREIEYFNLDMILSIGYRVDSKEATQFRKWATKILKSYLIDGYAINEKRLSNTKELLNSLKQTIEFLANKSIGYEKELLRLLQSYSKSLTLLEKYDKSDIEDIEGKEVEYRLTYSETQEVLLALKDELIKKGEASELFAKERDEQLDGIVNNLYQTFGGLELYKSIEDKASHLLYFIIKDHPFVDGNKRSASFLFVYFLDRCNYLYKESGEKKINDNALTVLTLLVASSNPKEKDLIVRLIKHLIFESENDA